MNSSLSPDLHSLIIMVKVLDCPKCTKQFNHKGKFKKHLMSHEQLKPFKCPECGVMLSAEWILKRHRETKHSGIKPYTCFQCNVSFTSKDHLHRHLNTRKHVPFVCELCERVFQRINAFQSHKCPKSAALDSSADRELLKSSENSELATSFSLFTQDSLDLPKDLDLNQEPNELERMTAESPVPVGSSCVELFLHDDIGGKVSREPSTECEIQDKWKCSFHGCFKEYSTRSNLRTHIRTAHEKVGFTCELCKSVIMHNHTLQKHLVICRERYLKLSL